MMRAYSGVFSSFIRDERIEALFCCICYVFMIYIRTRIVYDGVYVHITKDTTVGRGVLRSFMNVTAVTARYVCVDDI